MDFLLTCCISASKKDWKQGPVGDTGAIRKRGGKHMPTEVLEGLLTQRVGEGQNDGDAVAKVTASCFHARSCLRLKT